MRCFVCAAAVVVVLPVVTFWGCEFFTWEAEHFVVGVVYITRVLVFGCYCWWDCRVACMLLPLLLKGAMKMRGNGASNDLCRLYYWRSQVHLVLSYLCGYGVILIMMYDNLFGV